ncbi:T9SS type A sorting domain-containing protein [Algibacter mikhailovii]|uniref:T9SS type A sorting domain-containing protein n=1 Tax=Algibacter mikhailovii TaxID=425498 RepID=UPI0024941675|nr:T9SS type A sorting domain-containing protein [Algibacter mikhailovii]
MKKIILIFIITLCFIGSPQLWAQGTCITTSTDGPYSIGIKATYETLVNGTDVKVTFQLLDIDKIVDLAYLWNPEPNFSETEMTKEDDNTFSLTLTAQSGTISKACKMVLNGSTGGGQIVTAYIDYEVNTDCSGTNDVTPPDNFTASVGAITPFSVELLLNADDDSGTMVYYATYGATTKAISASAGVQKSFVLSGLTSETAYSFNVSASDLAGNTASNTIPLAATTTLDTSTACAGFSATGDQPDIFDVGYNYAFETLANGTDVKFTFELLDNKIGTFAYLWRSPSSPEGFLETEMNLVSGQEFTLTVPQTPDTTISYACKFAYQGGQSNTKYFNYVVGEDCVLSIDNFEKLSFDTYPNPTSDSWIIKSVSSNILSVIVFDSLGKSVVKLSGNSNEVKVEAEQLKSGLYFAQVKTTLGIQSLKLIKK